MKRILSWFNVITDDDSRVFGLDLFRAIAILLVLVAHGKFLLVPFSSGFGVLKLGGFFGVELFFVLSGYLIGTILIKLYNKDQSFNFSTIKDFWIRRWFRTLPNYYLALLLNILLLFLFVGQTFFPLSYFFFTQSLHTAPPNQFFGESWSLTVEEWFYFLFPLCLLTFVLLLGKADKKKNLLISILSFLFIIFVLRLVVVIAVDPPWDAGLRRVTQTRLDSIVLGVLFSYIAYYHKEWWKAKANLMALIGLGLTLFSILYYFKLLKADGLTTNLFSKTGYFTLVSLGFACLIPKASLVKSVRNTFFARFIIHTSLISYSLYLYHFTLILNTVAYLHTPDRTFTTIGYYFGFWVGSYILCTLIYKYFEKPCTNIRERFSGRNKKITYRMNESQAPFIPSGESHANNSEAPTNVIAPPKIGQ